MYRRFFARALRPNTSRPLWLLFTSSIVGCGECLFCLRTSLLIRGPILWVRSISRVLVMAVKRATSSSSRTGNLHSWYASCIIRKLHTLTIFAAGNSPFLCILPLHQGSKVGQAKTSLGAEAALDNSRGLRKVRPHQQLPYQQHFHCRSLGSGWQHHDPGEC